MTAIATELMPRPRIVNDPFTAALINGSFLVASSICWGVLAVLVWVSEDRPSQWLNHPKTLVQVQSQRCNVSLTLFSYRDVQIDVRPEPTRFPTPQVVYACNGPSVSWVQVSWICWFHVLQNSMHRQSQLKIQAQVVWVRQAQVFHSFNGPKAERIFIFSNPKIPPRSRGADMLSFALMGWHLRCPKCDLDQQKFDKFALKSPFGFFLTKNMLKFCGSTKLTSLPQITNEFVTVVGEKHITSPWWLVISRATKCKTTNPDLDFGWLILPRKLTWNPKMEVWKMIFLFKQVIFRFHVSFRECIRWKFNITRPGAAEETNVRVAARVRPLLPRDTAQSLGWLVRSYKHNEDNLGSRVLYGNVTCMTYMIIYDTWSSFVLLLLMMMNKTMMWLLMTTAICVFGLIGNTSWSFCQVSLCWAHRTWGTAVAASLFSKKQTKW